ncbi:MAG TPA: AAA family ATPase, partial [Arenibaculum sp.]|nr:AAA family ATPase [Arenibaculum sp.]
LNAASPDKKRIVAIGLVFGLFAGMLLVLAMEWFDTTYRTIPQLEGDTGHPVLGLLPALRRRNRTPFHRYVAERPLSAAGEGLRSIAAVLQSPHLATGGPRVVMVASALPGEGKSAVCVALARFLAANGQRVLVIDGDFRRPALTRLFDTPIRGATLDEVLNGDAPVAAALHRDPLSTARFIPARAIDTVSGMTLSQRIQVLLSFGRMRSLLDELPPYDWILIDTPPVMAVADAGQLGRVADTILFVVDWGRTERNAVRGALEHLRKFGVPVDGLVLNKVNTRRMHKYRTRTSYYSPACKRYFTD